MSMAMPAVEAPSHPDAPDREVLPNGRLRENGVTDADCYFALAMHLSPFGFFIVGPLAFIAPLILWIVRKDHSVFNDDQGRETTNLMITGALFFGATCVAMWITFGLAWVVFIAWCIAIGINMIRGAIAGSHGEYFRYPMNIRFIK